MFLSRMLLASGLLSGAVLAAPTATIAAGKIHGTTCPSTDVNAFLSVPFAQPPVGDLRLAAPEPSHQFPNGEWNATKLPPACYQFGNTAVFPGPYSEDCLFLNIWAPANATNASLPVKVWLHGGDDMTGSISDPLYNGCNTGTDAVIVSVAYRLGAFGFLALESAGIRGNFAIQDVLLALRWVQENIHAFGGNKNQVLLFGQSSGAALSWITGTLPQAETLMAAVASESEAGRDLVTKPEYEKFGATYAKRVDCSTTNITCFRSVPAQRFNASFQVVPATTIATVDKFQPYVDGVIIPVQPVSVGTKVPLLAGSNTMDGTFFTLAQYTDPKNVTEADYYRFLVANFGSLAETVNKTYAITAFDSTPFPGFYAISTVLTDMGFKCPARRALQANLNSNKTAYTYIYGHDNKCSWESALKPDVLPVLGATHTAEIPQVFRQFSHLPLPNGNCTATAAETHIGDTLAAAWRSMAVNRNPGMVARVPGDPLEKWVAYNGTASKGLVVTNSTDVAEVDYSVCCFWDQINAAVVKELQAE